MDSVINNRTCNISLISSAIFCLRLNPNKDRNIHIDELLSMHLTGFKNNITSLQCIDDCKGPLQSTEEMIQNSGFYYPLIHQVFFFFFRIQNSSHWLLKPNITAKSKDYTFKG